MLIDYYNKPKEDINVAFQKERERIRKWNKQRLNQQKEQAEIEKEVEKQLEPLLEKVLAELFRDLM